MIPLPSIRGSRQRCAVSLLSVAALLLTGCVSSNRTALAPAAQAQLKTVSITATVNQPELAADVLRSNIGQSAGAQGGFIGGLIGGIIDATIEAKRSKAAESDITPVRDSLVDFNAPEELRAALVAELQNGNPPVPISSVALAAAKDDDAVRKLVAASKSDAVLVITTDYHLSPEFDRIRVLAQVKLLSPKSSGRDESGPLYHNEFATYRPLPASAGSGRASAAAAWAANKGALAREAMKSCFAELAAMIKFDLGQGAEVNLLPKESLTTTAPAAGRQGVVMGPGVVFKGAVAQQHGDRKWVRLQSGELSSTE
ncbi:MAG: hypothetical protein HY302_10455 [Opitutae bacterium]|nr:hypothetical protein [Opitutae bacterium]